MKLEIPGYVCELMDQLTGSGYECYVVGGAVRSLLLGLPVHDYDLTTNALPEQMQEVFASYKTIATGLKHGTLTVLSHHHPIEITTYRKDSTYQDHRHPDAVEFTSAIEEDCARRDFTINALCYNESAGLLDFFHGQEDMKQHILRCIGDPAQRFEEDALRIVRAIRFASQLHFQIEENTKKAIFAKKELLSYISLERIHEEMHGFLQADTCGEYLDTYRSVLQIFFPEIIEIADWPETQKEIDACGTDPDVRMAVLLTTLKEPETILKRLKYANEDIRFILSCLNKKDAVLTDKISLRKFLSDYKGNFTEYLNYRSALDSTFPKAKLQDMQQEIIKNHDCISLSQLAVNGNDIKKLGCQGSEISEVLHQLLNAVMEDQISNTREELLMHVKRED